MPVPGLEAVLQRLAALAVAIFFRDVGVAGAERVPERGPLLVVANHVNSLVDPVLLLARLPRRPRFLAKSTLWRNPFLRPWLGLAGAVPVHRRQDPGMDPAGNLEAFARCHRLLADGAAVAIFPEGMSHDEPQLQPLRTGVARILLEAEHDLGPLGVRIVPVGLVFDDKQTFRSRALVLVGPPIDPASLVDPTAGAEPDAVRVLTGAVAAALREVTPNYGSWREARLVERAAAVFARPAADDTRRAELAESFPLHRAFRDGLAWFEQRHPARLREAAVAVRRYDRLLRVAGLRDEQVAARYPRAVVLRYLARTLAVLLLWLPLAVVGTVLCWIPYRLVGEVARRAAPTPDTRATYKLFSSVMLFPVWWLVEALVGWRVGGPAAAGAVALAAPVAGYAALRFEEQRAALAAEARAFLLLRSPRRAVTELRAARRRLVAKVGELVDLYRAAHDGPAWLQ